jgi:hypothetical protein
MRAGGVARGVDLNLDEFSLSEAGAYAGDLQAAGADAPIGSAFWSSIDSVDEAAFKGEDSKLLQEIFNRTLSDRRDEGDLFMPPATSPAYVQRLRNLVKEEGLAREERKRHFISSDFKEANAGLLFPSSWQASFQLAKGQDVQQGSRLQPRPEYLCQAASDALRSTLATAEPSFDKTTEDGARFRVYHVGKLEVRTIQERASDEEELGAVFASQA